MATRVGLILCLVACALGAAASRASADGAPTVIADGVQIGSVVVGGMTSDEATTAVQTAYYLQDIFPGSRRSGNVFFSYIIFSTYRPTLSNRARRRRGCRR